MDISPVRADELAEIFFLERAIEPLSGASLETLQARQRMFGAGFLAARKKGRIIGYIETCLWDLTVPEFAPQTDFFTSRHSSYGQILYIIFMGVEQNFRRHGAGSALLAAAIDLAHECGAREVQAVTHHHLLPLYSKMGFTMVQKMPNFLPNSTDFYLMRKYSTNHAPAYDYDRTTDVISSRSHAPAWERIPV